VILWVIAALAKRFWVWFAGWRASRHPERLGPASMWELEQTMKANAWGKDRYRPESHWNVAEGKAYLRLLRRDVESAQSFQVTVRDPNRVEHQTNPMAMANHFVCIYPDDFREASDSPAVGNYDVTWSVLVGTASGPEMREVARDQFHVPLA
jgi:hypothetical protein